VEDWRGGRESDGTCDGDQATEVGRKSNCATFRSPASRRTRCTIYRDSFDYTPVPVYGRLGGKTARKCLTLGWFLMKTGYEGYNSHETSEMTYVRPQNQGLENNSQCQETLRQRFTPLTSSSGVKSVTILKSTLISSGVFPLIIPATTLHPMSLQAVSEIHKLRYRKWRTAEG
jgi:hypothetical protein